MCRGNVLEGPPNNRLELTAGAGKDPAGRSLSGCSPGVGPQERGEGMARRAETSVPNIDLRRLPLEPLLARALQGSQTEFSGTCSVLSMLAQQGRVDAGVVLLGLLAHFRADVARPWLSSGHSAMCRAQLWFKR